MVEQATPARIYAAAEAVHGLARGLLLAHGVPADDAETVARCLVDADLRGVDTHGVNRLPGYVDRVRRGLINPRPAMTVTRPVPVAASIDGDNGFGFVVATRAMAEAIAIAKAQGLGIAAARRSTHFGMAASYALQAMAEGLIAIVATNASPAMPPWGGRRAMLGTSPLCAGAPGGARGPFLLDMATAVAARGKIRRAARRGEAIPLGYALDAEGRPTTDPVKALEGVVLPVGEHKGSGISMLMDILGGVAAGAACAGEVRDQYKDFSAPQNVGHFFLAMRPDLFVPLDEYRARMDRLVDRVKSCPPAEGFTEVLMPGEPELRCESERRGRGIPLSRGEVDALNAEAEKARVPPLAVSDVPLRA